MVEVKPPQQKIEYLQAHPDRAEFLFNDIYREIDIFLAYWGIIPPNQKTKEELANEYKISETRVMQIVNKWERWIKNPARDIYFK